LAIAPPGRGVAALPGRNGDLVFTTGGPGAALAQLTYWRIHPDGTGRTRITAAVARRLTAVSPDGRLLAEAVSDLGLVVQPSGGGRRRVIVRAPDVRAVSWFPDGQLAFLRGAFGAADLFTVHADGRHLRRLTRGVALEGLTVSPTGREIAAARRGLLTGDVADWDLVAIGARDGRVRVVERSAWAQALDPGGFDWAPDGRALAVGRIVASAPGGEPGGQPGGIEIVRRHGSRRRHLSPPGAVDAGPFFSPDGRFVAFSGFCAAGVPQAEPVAGPTGRGICVMRRDGTQRRAVAQTVLTPGAGVDDVSFTGVEWGSPWLRATRATAHPPNVPPPPYAVRRG
jgi:Tol biopolymer transport system component